jgi:G:T-mismatch repair DNA endonuclease (very short patch repair protein)
LDSHTTWIKIWGAFQVRLKHKLLRRHNPNYWIAKIASNRERDREVSRMLAKAGWKVVRIWETDILSDPQEAARSIYAIVRRMLLERRVPHGSVRGIAARNTRLA